MNNTSQLQAKTSQEQLIIKLIERIDNTEWHLTATTKQKEEMLGKLDETQSVNAKLKTELSELRRNQDGLLDNVNKKLERLGKKERHLGKKNDAVSIMTLKKNKLVQKLAMATDQKKTNCI